MNRIIVGAGNTKEDGWISLQESALDITSPEHWLTYFRPNSLDAILAEHVWEHLTLPEGQQAAMNCYQFLKYGGCLRIAVPDGLHTDPRYIAWVAPGTGFNGDDHKVLYNYRTLSELLARIGFTVQLKEYFDETGSFHHYPLEAERGYIHRSAFSSWATFLSLPVGCRYTSLIVDALKL